MLFQRSVVNRQFVEARPGLLIAGRVASGRLDIASIHDWSGTRIRTQASWLVPQAVS